MSETKGTWLDIPSDCESVDGLCDSDSEELELEQIDSELAERDKIDEYDSGSDEEVLSDRLQKMDGMWECKKRSRYGGQFTEQSGPNVPDSAVDPLDVFHCLFPVDFIDYLVEQTNLYHDQSGKKSDPVTRKEMLVFLAINIIMGVKRLPSYRDYWSMNPQLNDPYISSLMTVNRFGFMLTYLHVNDNAKAPKRDDPNFDKLYKLRPMITKLNETFKASFKPNEHQSIDESMVKFKGRNSMKQYNAAKPIKRGYKLWIRADETGYICEFQVYAGKVGNITEKSLGARVVKDLTREIVGRFHQVYFDNFFTTVDLMVALQEDNILAAGTVRKDRVKLPKLQIPDKLLQKGQSEFRTSYTGTRWVKWMDNRPVRFLSNFHDPSESTSINRKQKDGSLLPVSCPTLVRDYNKHMGYVDKADMLKSTYQINRKAKKW